MAFFAAPDKSPYRKIEAQYTAELCPSGRKMLGLDFANRTFGSHEVAKAHICGRKPNGTYFSLLRGEAANGNRRVSEG